MSDPASLIQDLENAIAAGTTATRLDALNRITDLFIAGSGHHSKDRIALFDDIFLTLANTIEVNARVQLSRRLASVPDSPPKVVRSLAFDDIIAVAAPVLIRSAQLNDSDLVSNAETKSQKHLQAITQRRELSEPVTDALIERGDSRVVQLVVKNAGARLSETGFSKIVAKARKDEGLARYAGTRRDIPRHHFLALLETASDSVRKGLMAANPALAEAVETVVSDIAADISGEVRHTSKDHAQARARVKRLCRTGQFGEADIHTFAQAQNFERTAVALATLGEFPIDVVERALLDKSPDLVLILAKSAQCCRSTARAILLMDAANRRMSAMDLDRTLAHYDRLQVSTAKRALEFYRLRRRANEDDADVRSGMAVAWFAESLPASPGHASR